MKITVKIGAALDGDLQKILYEPLAAGASRARQRVRTEMGKTFDEVGARAKEAIKIETATRLIEERKRAQSSLAIQKSQLASERQLRAQERAHELAMERDAARQRVREDEKASREVVKNRREALREEARVRKENESGVRSFAGSAAGTARSIVSRGVGVAADIARGAGVSFDIASGVKKRVDLESAAVGLANAGYQEGKSGAAGTKQDPRAIMADIQKAGETYGIGQMDIAGALDKFVGKTGELQTGREMIEAFAKTSKATGATMEDVAAAAGAISNKLGDVPDKANAINKVMLAIAGQGKEGAVEIKDLATQMEKLTSMASKFQANDALKGLIGDDTGANIAMLGVLSQSARKTEKGSAAQATQSAMAFVRDLTSQTATKRILTQAGINLYADKGRTKLNDVQEITKDIISKTKGDQTKLSYLMSNQNSRAVVNSFMDPYLKAYNATKGSDKEKDKAGRDAVDAAFKTLKDATMSDKVQQDAVNAALASTGTKVEQFQQKLDRVVGDMADNVIPAMMKLAPTALNAAGAMSKVAVWAAEHPLGAAGAAAGAGLAKAMADAAGAAIAKSIGGALAGSSLLAGLTVGSLIIASVGMMAIDHVAKNADDASKNAFKADMEALNAMSELRAAEKQYKAEVEAGAPTAETVERLEKAREKVDATQADTEKRILSGQGYKDDEWGDKNDLVTSAFNSFMKSMGSDFRVGGGQTSEEYAAAAENAEKLDALKAELSEMKATMAQIDGTLKGTLRVEAVGALPGLPGATTGPGPGGG